jgi:hypothetical protein
MESGQLHAPAALTSGKVPLVPIVGGWVVPIAGMDVVVKRKIPSLYRDSNLRSFSA